MAGRPTPKRTLPALFVGAVLVFLAPALGAAVIFSDDFSTWPDYDFTPRWTGQVPHGGWSSLKGGESATLDGVEHWCGEVKTPGRGGSADRALQLWRQGTFQFNYCGELDYYGEDLFGHRELYNRWYMRIPQDFELHCPGGGTINYLKLWRYTVCDGPGGLLVNWCPNTCGSGYEIYLNFQPGADGTFSSGSLGIAKSVNPGAGWHRLASTSTLRDGQWHAYELRMKLNDEGQANAEIQFWLDGVEQQHYTGLDYGARACQSFSAAWFGLGNTGARDSYCAGGTFQREWRAIELDDYVLSTDYVGPVSAPLAPPSPPAGLRLVDVAL